MDSSSLGIETEDLSVSDEIITDNRAEAMSALVVLGYSANDARNVLSKLDSSLSTEDLIKQALVKLM